MRGVHSRYALRRVLLSLTTLTDLLGRALVISHYQFLMVKGRQSYLRGTTPTTQDVGALSLA